MCAFAAKDGKKFSMASRMRAHNMSTAAKDRSQDKPENAILDAPGDEGEPDGDEMDPHAVAAEHGPAHSVHIMHPAEGEGEHTVESEHPDGHKHHSSHGSAREAHDHAAALAGAGEDHGEPDGDEGEDCEY